MGTHPGSASTAGWVAIVVQAPGSGPAKEWASAARALDVPRWADIQFQHVGLGTGPGAGFRLEPVPAGQPAGYVPAVAGLLPGGLTPVPLMADDVPGVRMSIMTALGAPATAPAAGKDDPGAATLIALPAAVWAGLLGLATAGLLRRRRL